MRKIEFDTLINKNNLKNIDDMMMLFFNELPPRERFELNFALHEVVINSLEAYEMSDLTEDKYILRMKIETGDALAKLEIIDFAGGMKVKIDNNVDNLIHGELNIRGRGMMFIEHYVDEFKWVTHMDGGLRVNLKKTLNAPREEKEDISLKA